jgi:flagellar biosynthesis/type III secretory pathway protein FliH
MITIKYKGEIVNLKDIEINWVEYNNTNSENCFVERTGDIEDYAQSKYQEGYDEGFENGFDEGTYQDA